jgi:Tol biopolymer transport system component
MKPRRITILLVFLVLIPAAGIIYLIGTPELRDVSPAAGATHIDNQAPLRLVFSRRMDTQSIRRHLTIDPPLSGEFSWQGSTLLFTPNEPWPSGKTITVNLVPGTRAAGWLSLPLQEHVSWSFTIRQPRLVYLYPAGEAANLYILNPETQVGEALTDIPAGVLDFDVSPDGKSIYYSVNNLQGGTSIYRLENFDTPSDDATQAASQPGSTLILACTRATCRTPKISPQGNFLAYERTAFLGGQEPTYTRVWLLPLGDNPSPAPGQALASQSQARLAGREGEQTMLPEWSPEGWLSIYNNTLAAFTLLNPVDGQAVQFANDTGQPGSWNPDGNAFVAPEISFIEPGDPQRTGLESIANSHLIRFNRQDGSEQDLSQAENLEDASPAYAPDGSTLAFTRKYLDIAHWTPGRQLWTMNADSSDVRQLTDDPFYHHYALAWKPGGEQLAYVRFNQTVLTDPPEIWVINPETAQANRLIVGGYAPQWIP